MNKWITKFGITILTVAILFSITMTAEAKGEDTIKKGIFISGIDVGGMTEEEATQAVLEYVEA